MGIIKRIIGLFRPQPVYVVCRAEDGSAIKNVEVYTDEHIAAQRQTQLGRGDTCVAERLIDDPRWARRPTARRIRGKQQNHLQDMRRRYA